MSIGGILNIILDPIFIFALHRNVEGAALATCLSNTVSMLYLLRHIVRTRNESAVRLPLLQNETHPYYQSNTMKEHTVHCCLHCDKAQL